MMTAFALMGGPAPHGPGCAPRKTSRNDLPGIPRTLLWAALLCAMLLPALPAITRPALAQGPENLRHQWDQVFYGQFGKHGNALLYNRSIFNGKPALGDLDGDGDMDMLVGRADGTIARFRNIGSAKRPQWELYQENISAVVKPKGEDTAQLLNIDVGRNAAPALVDIDRDNDMDLFVGNAKGNILFFRNIGNPTLAAYVLVTSNFIGAGFGTYITPYFHDVDNDRAPDLFVGNRAGQVYLMINQGTPKRASFCLDFPRPDALPDEEPPCTPTPMQLASIQPENNAAPALVDWDQDGDPDLFIGKSNGAISYHENVGTSFKYDWLLRQRRFLAIDEGGYAAPALGDLNGDGVPDILIGSGSNSVTLYTYQGTRNPMDIWKVTGNYLNIMRLALGLTRVTLASGDLDADGDLDLLVGESSGRLIWLENTGNAKEPAWQIRQQNLLSGSARGNTAPWLVDLDGDGDLDLLVGGSDGRLWFFNNRGTPKEPDFALISTNFASIDVGNDSVPVMVDLDGDKDDDLAIGNRRGFVIYFRNDGTAAKPDFRLASTRLGTGRFGQSAAPAFFDWDGDKKPDLVVGISSGKLVLDANKVEKGDQKARTWERQGENWGNFRGGRYATPHFADLNGDGKPDLLMGDGEGNVQLWLNGGPITVVAKAGVSMVDEPKEDGQDSGGDTGGDPIVGIPVDPNQESSSGLSMGGGGGQTEGSGGMMADADPAEAANPTDVPVDPEYVLKSEKYADLTFNGRATPALADLDGDGDLDMVVGTGKGQLILFRNDGTKQAAKWTKVTESLGGHKGRNPAPALADLDGDGKIDLLVGTEDGKLRIYRNTGQAGTGGFELIPNVLTNIKVGRNAVPTLMLVDKDDRPDLVLGDFSGKLITYVRSGSAKEINFELHNRNYMRLDVGVGSTPFSGDVNNDKMADLLIGSDQGTVLVIQRVEPSKKAPQGWLPNKAWLRDIKFPFGARPRLADLDGDGDMDLLVGTEKGVIYHFDNEAIKPAQ